MNKLPGIDDNFTKITEQKSINSNQIKVANIYFMLSEIFTGKTKKLIENNDGEVYVFESECDHSDQKKESNLARQRFAEQPNKKANEQPDTTGMSDLENEESAAQGKEQKAKELKTLAPNQMLNRLSISLAQLNAGNNSEQLEKRNQTIIVFFVQIKKTYKTNL